MAAAAAEAVPAEGEAPAEPEVIKKGKAEAAEGGEEKPEKPERPSRGEGREEGKEVAAGRHAPRGGPGQPGGPLPPDAAQRGVHGGGRAGRALGRCARWRERPTPGWPRPGGRRGRSARQARDLHEPQRGGGGARPGRARAAAPQDLVVVLDDVALELGTLRVRERGSHGGHNGLRSLIEMLGTDEFPRVRVGIRKGEPPGDLAEYVLSEFPEEDVLVVQEVVGLAGGRGRVPLPRGRGRGHEPLQRRPAGARLAPERRKDVECRRRPTTDRAGRDRRTPCSR